MPDAQAPDTSSAVFSAWPNSLVSPAAAPNTEQLGLVRRHIPVTGGVRQGMSRLAFCSATATFLHGNMDTSCRSVDSKLPKRADPIVQRQLKVTSAS